MFSLARAVDPKVGPEFTGTMHPGQSVSMLCFSESSDEIAAVLDDAGCSFMDRLGRFHLAHPSAASGQRDDVGVFCAEVMDRARGDVAVGRIDLGAGREPVAPGVLVNPIELLHWIITQAAAVDFHPTVNAYIFSCDPDDILPFLPFHPAPGRGGEGVADVLAVRLWRTGASATPLSPGSIQIERHSFLLASSVT